MDFSPFRSEWSSDILDPSTFIPSVKASNKTHQVAIQVLQGGPHFAQDWIKTRTNDVEEKDIKVLQQRLRRILSLLQQWTPSSYAQISKILHFSKVEEKATKRRKLAPPSTKILQDVNPAEEYLEDFGSEEGRALFNSYFLHGRKAICMAVRSFILSLAQIQGASTNSKITLNVVGELFTSIRETYRTAQTYKNAVCSSRKLSRALGVSEEILKLVVITKEEQEAVIKMEQDNSQRRAVQSYHVPCASRLLQVLLHPLQDPSTATVKTKDVVRLYAAIQLATGRRSAEILKTANFIPIPGENYWCFFNGTCKGEQDRDNFPIPILCKIDVLLQALPFIRNFFSTEGLTTFEVERKYNKRINNHLQQIMAEKDILQGQRTSFSSHLLRKLYVAIAFPLISKTDHNISQHIFLTKVLGHTSTKSAFAYSNVNIDPTTIGSLSLPDGGIIPINPFGWDAPINEQRTKIQ